MHTLFFDMLTYAIKGNMAKDKWSDFVMPRPFGQTSIKKSARHRVEYEFGIYQDQFSLQAWIIHPTYIRLMPDLFWRTILSLSDIGELRFEPSAIPKIDKSNRYQRELFRSNASVIFSIIRNYIVLMEQQQNDYGDISLGRIEVNWSADTPIQDTFDRACRAFSTLYRLNGQIHRMWFVDYKANLKRHFNAMTQEQQSFYGSFEGFMRMMQPPDDE